MKKSIFMLAGAALALAACNPEPNGPITDPILVTPVGEGIMAENISSNAKYAAGSTDMAIPAVWDIEAGRVVVADVQTDMGAFHAVNNDGLAVGGYANEEYATIPILFDAKTGTITELANPDGDSEAYGITKDGKTIVGFHFDAAWVTHACIWTNNGQTQTDLPVPTEEQTGFAIDYCSSRWISEDGKVILGYVQDNASGAWVAMAWELKDGQYVVNGFCKDYFQVVTEYDWDTWEPVLPENPNPYLYFEPYGLSANGEWALLAVRGIKDETSKPARYNLKTNVIEVLDAEAEFFGIANDGTAVGRLNEGGGGIMLAPEKEKQNIRRMPGGSVDAVIWKAGETTCTKLADLYPEDANVQAWTASQLSGITGDGRRAAGFAATATDLQGIMVKLKH